MAAVCRTGCIIAIDGMHMKLRDSANPSQGLRQHDLQCAASAQFFSCLTSYGASGDAVVRHAFFYVSYGFQLKGLFVINFAFIIILEVKCGPALRDETNV